MNKRLEYLDCLRGIVMLMVVFTHTCGHFCLNCKDSFWLNHIFSIVMLPGFFFISGWFTSVNTTHRGIIKRFKAMLIPTALMFTIYVFFYWGNMEKFSYCISEEYKFGYWFTFALFLMNLLHWGTSWILSCSKKISDTINVIALICITILLVLLKDWDWNHNEALLAKWFSLRLVAMYFPFYVLGICCKKWECLFHRIINNEYIVAITMIVFLAGLSKQDGGFYFGLLMGILSVFLLYRLVFFYQDSFSEKTKIGRQLCIIGRNTLPIYLIHYFFFLGLKLPEVEAGLDIHTQWGVITTVALLLTLLIVYSSLGIAKLLALSKPLSKILIGTK